MYVADKYGIVHSDFPKLIDYLESLGYKVSNRYRNSWGRYPIELHIY